MTQNEMLSAGQRQMITEALQSRGVNQPCPRCRNNTFEVAPALTHMQLQGMGGGLMIGGSTVPAAIVLCSRCGNVSLHALGSLGLLSDLRFNPEAAA